MEKVTVLEAMRRMGDDQYAENPLKHAAYLALKEYVENGGKFCDLPWFSLSESC